MHRPSNTQLGTIAAAITVAGLAIAAVHFGARPASPESIRLLLTGDVCRAPEPGIVLHITVVASQDGQLSAGCFRVRGRSA